MRKLIPLGILVGLLALLALPLYAGGPPSDPPGLERAIAAQEAHTDALLAKSRIVGTAVGLGADGQPVVKIYTESAGIAGLPKKLDGFPVVVQVTGEIIPRSDPQASFPRPVPIGVSSGNERLVRVQGLWYCFVGTLGARVTDGMNVFALSSNHVYALERKGEIGDRILQPGRVDMTAQACGSQAEIDAAEIGTLHTVVPIQFKRNANNTVDAAMALTTTGMVGTGTPADDGYGTPSSTIVAASLGQAVQKYGRTTGLTAGTVVAINATPYVGYDSGIARFVNQIEISDGSFSAGGDSGSLIVTNDASNNPVALLFAGG